MVELMAYSVYDSKTMVFQTPWFMLSRGAALRGFADLVNDERSSVNKHPEDYSLFEIGKWKDDTGEFVPMTPVNLGVAASYKNVPVFSGNPLKNGVIQTEVIQEK